MYENFTQTTDGGYSLKKQGVVSTVIIGGALAVSALFCMKNYLDSQKNNLLFFAGIMLLFSLIIFWRGTKQFIIYPKQKTFKYSKGLGAEFQEFRFDELDGVTKENIKNLYGLTTGNSFKLGFEQSGKYKEVLLGQNISAKKMRSISEEINQIMANN